jgi:hypothetical protein
MNDKLDKILAKMERLEQQVHELHRTVDQYAVVSRDNLLHLDDNIRLRINNLDNNLQREIKRKR